MKEKYIKPLNSSLNFKLITIPDTNMAFTVIEGAARPEQWYYSDNNISSDRDEIFKIAGKIDDSYKFSAELTVFAGNIFGLIFSQHHPKYYLCQIENPSPRDKTPFVRSCKEIPGFTPWQNCVKVSQQGIRVFQQFYSWDNPEKIPVKGITSMLVAGLFLAECDWSNSNFGLIEGENQLIKIDPGLCLDNDFLDNNPEDIYYKLSNLLENFIYEMTDEGYFQEFKADNNDESATALIHQNVMQLFCAKDELFETLYKICTLSDNDYFKEVQQNSSGDYQEFWNKFFYCFKNRITCFKRAALKLDGFSEYLFQKNSTSLQLPMSLSAPLLPLVTQNVPYTMGPGLNFFTHFVPGPEIPGFWRYPHIAPPGTNYGVHK